VGAAALEDAVVWHDVECGTYAADLPLWFELAAAAAPAPILDVGAGTGRVALALARAGHAVHALERDPRLLDAVGRRTDGLPVTCARADACAFSLDPTFGLCLVAMQTIHLLADRPAFLRRAHASLAPGGVLAAALLGPGVEPFEAELEPDRTIRDGVLYESRPTSLRLDGDGSIVLERRRERTDPEGLRVERDVIRLAPVTPAGLAAEARAAGFEVTGSRTVAPTEDRAGSVVLVMARPAR
jgi:SAM-dependent methyltransferase